MLEIDFSNRTKKFRVNKHKLFSIIKKIGKLSGTDSGILSLSFVEQEEIRKINKKFRGKDTPTNVISFPFMDVAGNKKLLGDIVICPLIAKKQAREQGNDFNDYVAFLIIHGFLHLIGYDHIKEKERIVMEKKEEEIFENLKIDNFIKEVDVKK